MLLVTCVDEVAATLRLETLLELGHRGLQSGNGVVLKLAGGGNVGQDRGLVTQVLDEACLEAQHVGDLNVVEVAVGAGPDGDNLLLDGVRGVLRLTQQLGQAGTAGQLSLGGVVQVGCEHRERFHRTVLCQLQLQGTGDLLHSLGLCGTTNAGHGDTDVHCRALVSVEQIGLQEDLAVSNGDDVGRDEGGNVVCLGLNDREAGH